VQCGICIPGMILAAKAVVDEHPEATADEVRQGLAGNLCRCTGYTKIFSAVAQAVTSARLTKPRRFLVAPAAPRYFRPRSLEEALEILAARAEEMRPLAGGTDILVKAKDGTESRAALFDLTAVPEIRGIQEQEGHVWIGAAATHTEMMRSPLVASAAPALPAACAVIGGPQIRNRGTLGGNLANASPAADTVPPLFVADAIVEVASISARRDVPITEFFPGPRQSVLARDELILGVRVPRRAGVRGAFLRLGQRQAQAISKVSIAVAIIFRDGRPDWVRVALGAVAPTVVRARETEKALMGGGWDALQRAKDAVRAEVRPIDDLRSTAEYRREMAAVLLERAVRRVAEA
jgi:CO/xanthine dehydrogenase FAD-binding subunit